MKEVKELEDKKYSVALTNKFTNGFGKNTESDIIIYTKPKDDKKPSDGYVIYDSKDYAIFLMILYICSQREKAIYKEILLQTNRFQRNSLRHQLQLFRYH